MSETTKKTESVFSGMGFLRWLRILVSGKPHFVIGRPEDPYLYRWLLVPRNRFFNLYLHKFLRDDEDLALHDHPWWFVSWLICGAYYEVTSGETHHRRHLSLALRSALHRHRVVLERDYPDDTMRVCWSLVLTGSKKRTWGFWCPKGFVPWFDFVKPNNPGEVGRGCE